MLAILLDLVREKNLLLSRLSGTATPDGVTTQWTGSAALLLTDLPTEHPLRQLLLLRALKTRNELELFPVSLIGALANLTTAVVGSVVTRQSLRLPVIE